MTPLRIGIDLGGTKIEGIVLGDNGEELHRTRVATPVGDYQGTIDAIVQIVADISGGATEATVGIGHTRFGESLHGTPSQFQLDLSQQQAIREGSRRSIAFSTPVRKRCELLRAFRSGGWCRGQEGESFRGHHWYWMWWWSRGRWRID